MRHYYLRQRSKSGKWYATIMNTITRKPELFRCTGTNDKNQAEAIAQDWLINGLPDSNKVSKDTRQLRSMNFFDYLKNFLEYDTSEYIKEKIKT